MCDDNTIRENEEYLRKEMTRRKFGKLSAAVGVAMMLPPVANAQSVTETDVEVTTPDGTADCYFVYPSTGSHAAVIVWPDILGLRPAFRAMGKRLAESGYSVLVVNPFYRSARSPVVEVGDVFSDPDVRSRVLPMAGALNADTHFTDARAFVSFLDQQSAVDTNRKIGTTGYCMGGPMVVRTTAAVPDRIGAGATFHGGGLVTDADNSPHLLIADTTAHALHCVAANDDERTPEAKNVLRDTYDAAGLPAEIEVYEGAMHGWCPPDSAVYNEPQAERAWARLLVLFENALA
ncbi:MAG: dienelactone hydrolase family protein [Gammaproteobacteria bacterium]|jgi:carboxymethylenebutenolidase|nr:dienelactone hydrolase [Gammaproteobacteria bacterium]MDP6096085.1 dienelactone hydrolase family protein [Gammaproteobacteria bacterium]HJO12355.1 dienelactone hydrolase family protein [Gammaproteobacteria bacterium]|tara:strand:+ start:1863 stop:2735 length:873 start_codon:yes stop_codon:yes gene_type:complete